MSASADIWARSDYAPTAARLEPVARELAAALADRLDPGAHVLDPAAGPAEWARVLVPGGTLSMTAWDGRGFLAEMTDRMMAAMAGPGQTPPVPPHMQWGEDGVAAERLGPWFQDGSIRASAGYVLITARR